MKHEWTSIKDQVPNWEDGDGKMYIVNLTPSATRTFGDIYLGCWYKGKFHWGFSKGYIMREVTHWMPLPNPPGEIIKQ